MPKEVSQQKAAVLGLQHLLAMYSGAVAVPPFNWWRAQIQFHADDLPSLN